MYHYTLTTRYMHSVYIYYCVYVPTVCLYNVHITKMFYKSTLDEGTYAWDFSTLYFHYLIAPKFAIIILLSHEKSSIRSKQFRKNSCIFIFKYLHNTEKKSNIISFQKSIMSELTHTCENIRFKNEDINKYNLRSKPSTQHLIQHLSYNILNHLYRSDGRKETINSLLKSNNSAT